MAMNTIELKLRADRPATIQEHRDLREKIDQLRRGLMQVLSENETRGFLDPNFANRLSLLVNTN